MNRRTTLTLTTMALSFLAVLFATALPQTGFAQSDPLIGTWKLNLAKSTFSPGPPPPKSQSFNVQGEGQNRKLTVVGIRADGSPQVLVFAELVEDGKPHPVTGQALGVDAQTYTRVDAHTVNVSRLKEGRVVQTMTWVLSPDGKTFTETFTNANGQQGSIFVFDRQ